MDKDGRIVIGVVEDVFLDRVSDLLCGVGVSAVRESCVDEYGEENWLRARRGEFSVCVGWYGDEVYVSSSEGKFPSGKQCSIVDFPRVIKSSVFSGGDPGLFDKVVGSVVSYLEVCGG